MTPLALAALALAQAAFGATPGTLPSPDAPLLLLAQTEPGEGEGEVEEEAAPEEEATEEEAPADDMAAEEAPADEDAAAEEAPAGEAAAEAPAAAPAPAAAVNPRAQELVSGAPLYNPNVAVHIVQQKQFSDDGKHELVLFPAVTQVNGKFTQHFGTALSYVYHLHENFGFQITPQFNWYNTESGFNTELINKVREQAQAATSLLLNWGVTAGVEVSPLYGKFAWYEDSLAQYSLILTGGAGYGSTRHQLKPENDAGPATFGDTGNRFVGAVGGGFRVLLGDRFAIRLEVRDIVYTARVDRVNGCDVVDLEALDAASRANRPLSGVQVSQGCDVTTYDGVDENNYRRASNIPLALSLVRDPTSDVLNLVSFYGGVSFIF